MRTGFNETEGMVVVQLVALGTLLVGDVVFIDVTTGRVSKSLTVADYASEVGIVVGGRKTYMEVLQDDIDIGEQAAVAGEDVIIAVGGIAKSLADAAIATAGLRLAPATATTAGRVKTAVATNFVIGLSLGAAAGAASIIRVLIRHSTTAMV